MAIPKVFVSSTCYDLAEERSQLERFISSYGFQPILSEFSDVFYDPDEHTHDACVKEVEHCDIFVLIISGRFGGKLRGGKGESITQAEYHAARRHNLPIFAFVKKDVLDAQFYFKENVRNQDENFAKKITYPAIHKQDDALSIFTFVEEVQRSEKGNAIESYCSFSEIEGHLKKQWAGLFYSFLQKRKEIDKVEGLTKMLEKLSGSTTKLEALVGSLHKESLGDEKTEILIHDSEILVDIEQFFGVLKKYIKGLIGHNNDLSYNSEDEFSLHFKESDINHMANVLPKDSFEKYLDKLGKFGVMDTMGDGRLFLYIGGPKSKFEGAAMMLVDDDLDKIRSLYLSVIKSNVESRKAALLKVFSEYIVVD